MRRDRGLWRPQAGRAGAAITCAALALSAGSATAQPTDRDKLLAETLFDEGKRLVAAGRHAEACPKFAESRKLDPGVGNLLHLAD